MEKKKTKQIKRNSKTKRNPKTKSKSKTRKNNPGKTKKRAGKPEFKKFKKSEYKRKKPIKKFELKAGKPGRYVLDTSAIIKKTASKLVLRGVKGTFIIHSSVVAELEHLANKGEKEGFEGLEELGKLQELKRKYKFSISFQGQRPTPAQIKFAKSGEIDALVRALAYKTKAILVTADYVQAKSALAYGIKVRFIPTKKTKPAPKKKFFRFTLR